MADRKKLNNLALRVSSKTLIHSMLARNVKDKLHEKMGNLTFMYSRKLIDNQLYCQKSDMQVVQKMQGRKHYPAE